MNTLHLATISLFIVTDLSLLLADRYLPLPGWLHHAAIILLAQAIILLWVALHRREKLVRSGLHEEISGIQQELAKTARRYKTLLEGAGNAIFVCNAQTVRLEEVNRRGAELFCYSREEVCGKAAWDLLAPSEYDRFRTLVQRLERHGRAEAEDLTFRRGDGSLFTGELDARLIELGDEMVVHCMVRDISEKVRVEREIWQRNRELSILNSILTGMNRGPNPAWSLRQALAETLELLQGGGGTVHLWDEEDGQPALLASQSVSERTEGLIRAGLAAAGSPRPDRLTVSCDPAGSPLLRQVAQEGWHCLACIPLMAQNTCIGVMHLLHPALHDYSAEETRFLTAVGTQLGNVIEQTRLFAELTWKSEELLRSYHLLEKSSHSLVLSESKLKQNLALVEQANRELNRLDRMKNQFLGMVSHEFNTPLTSIISGAEFLLNETREEQSAVVLNMVREGGIRLRSLVGDLLRLIKLEARGGELSTSALQLRHALEGLKESLQPQLNERGQSLKLTGLESLPFFEGDWRLLERVFTELLLNAMRFSPHGGEIEVTGRVVDGALLEARRATLERFHQGFLARCGERSFVEVEVRDSGIGIPVEEQQEVFEIFYEIGEIRHHTSGRGGKGAGLGLAIVKGMVEAHGGMVWVESKGGSSFFVLLPLEQELIQPELF